MSVERRGQVIRVSIMLVNWQQEEPTDCGEGRQLFMDDTSRVSREAQARFCERLGVRFPGATRPTTDAGLHAIGKRSKRCGTTQLASAGISLSTSPLKGCM